MTRERFQELIYIHEEIDDLRTKIVDLTRAKKRKPELYIPKEFGYSISIVYISNENYESIIDYEIEKCQEQIETLTKEFEKS
jgi:hypothetical protein